MIFGDSSGDLSIHLFGPRGVDVVGAKPGFHMTDRDLLIECGKSRRGRGGCISMHKHQIRVNLFEHITHTRQHTCRNVIEVLSLFHDVEIIVWCDLKYFEHLIKHFTMLTGNADKCLEFIWMFLELFNKWSHLDGFRSSPKN